MTLAVLLVACGVALLVAAAAVVYWPAGLGVAGVALVVAGLYAPVGRQVPAAGRDGDDG